MCFDLCTWYFVLVHKCKAQSTKHKYVSNQTGAQSQPGPLKFLLAVHWPEPRSSYSTTHSSPTHPSHPISDLPKTHQCSSGLLACRQGSWLLLRPPLAPPKTIADPGQS